MNTLRLPPSDLRALAEGEVVVAFVPSGAVSVGDEVSLEPGPARAPEELKPAYRRWVAAPPAGTSWTAKVVAVHPADRLDRDSGDARHLLVRAPEEGDLVVLRVRSEGRPVLSDDAFAARVRSLAGALR